MVEKLKRDIAGAERKHKEEIAPVVQPSIGLLCKLGSIIIHAEELSSPDGHHYDAIALQCLMADIEVKEWLSGMRSAALLPVKRKEGKAE